MGLETNNGKLHRASFPGTSGAMIEDPETLTLEAITNSNGETVGVYFVADGALELHEIPGVIHALQGAIAPHGQHDRRPDIAELIERSSLGTPEAQALRATVSDDHAREIVARAHRADRAEVGPEADRPCGVTWDDWHHHRCELTGAHAEHECWACETRIPRNQDQETRNTES